MAARRRRKIRKGTHSCWECKRRKMKCVFGSPTDPACVDCQRRGAKCVSQEFPDEALASSTKGHHVDDRIARIETLVRQMLERGEAGTADPSGDINTTASPDAGHASQLGIATPQSIESWSPYLVALLEPTEHGSNSVVEESDQSRLRPPDSRPGKHDKLSRVLHSTLPSPQDTKLICQAFGGLSILLLDMQTVPYKTIYQDGLQPPEGALVPPGPDAHPVLIARHMLHLSQILQHWQPDVQREIQSLSESPQVLLERLAGTAISTFTTNEELLGSIEGLQCIMMESQYQSNSGNLRRSWLAIRRALSVAQLMGLHRQDSRARHAVLDPTTKYDPQLMWFRILWTERHLCLMLGLPQGSADCVLAADELQTDDEPVDRLERFHCVLTSRILQRNRSSSGLHDLSLTHGLDVEMQKAARGLPSKWWLLPNLDKVADDPQALFGDLRRLFNQIFHYNLLNQLHLPYMLRSSSEGKFDYSRSTCVNASREILSRFNILRAFNRNPTCRTVDFFALTAAMTLLLAHLDSHRSSSRKTANMLAHQRLSDRAVMEHAQDIMEEISVRSADALSSQSASLLRQLLAIEAEAADGRASSADNVDAQPSGGAEAGQPESRDSNSGVRVFIPYFGNITIARGGTITKEVPGQRQAPTTSHTPDRSYRLAAASTAMRSSGPGTIGAHGDGSGALPSGATHNHQQGLQAMEGLPPQEGAPFQLSEFPDSSLPAAEDGSTAARLPHDTTSGDCFLQPSEYPGLIAGMNDWAFQGVDMAFFDSLMCGIENNGAEWPA